MFLKTSNHTNNYLSSPIDTKPSVLWKFKTNAEVISSAVIVNNVLYIGSNDNNMYAINANNGNLIWKFKTKGKIPSTPLVANNKVMFLSYDGFFYALNANNGKLVWKFKTLGEETFKVKDYFNGKFKPDFWDFYLSSATTKGNNVYFGSSDKHIYALDIETGKLNWKTKVDGSVHTSPALKNNILVVADWESNIYALNANEGNEVWKFTTGKDTAQYIWHGVQASPSISENNVFIGSRDAKFYSLNIQTGEAIWVQNNFNKSWMPSSAAISKDNIYTGSSDSFAFFALQKETGEIKYKTKTNSYAFSSPAIDSTMAYIGAANGILYGIELKNGNIKWEYETNGRKTDTLNIYNKSGVIEIEKLKTYLKGIDNMPKLTEKYTEWFKSTGAILSSPTIYNNTIYFGSNDGYIYALKQL
ncbi:MAG TPA: PQQ-binding-like beta-propeller repeat protein [Flavobacteriaceae bacterium]|nr:PQQ-binding-like beta-propeller repeat protein [Flavobacteriaceae bacterium]